MATPLGELGLAILCSRGQLSLNKDEARKIRHLLSLNQDKIMVLQQVP
jgi:cyanate lyase